MLQSQVAGYGKNRSVKQNSSYCQKVPGWGGKVGLITGCFDVLHIGHVRLFKWAKKRVDLLIVGLDSDGSICLSKGKGRPIFSQKVRLETLSELSSVNYVFGIRGVFDFKSKASDVYYKSLMIKIKPDCLITHVSRDVYMGNKASRAKECGARLILYCESPPTSSTEVIEKIRKL